MVSCQNTMRRHYIRELRVAARSAGGSVFAGPRGPVAFRGERRRLRGDAGCGRTGGVRELTIAEVQVEVVRGPAGRFPYPVQWQGGAPGGHPAPAAPAQ